jgi:hypothetical protein
MFFFPAIPIPTGLLTKALGCSAQRGYPGNQVLHTTYPNVGCEIIGSITPRRIVRQTPRDGAAYLPIS